VQLGDLIGNDYVVISGLKAGDQLIVGGIQKIGDGLPVKAGPPAAAPAANARSSVRRRGRNHGRRFHSPTGSRGGLLAIGAAGGSHSRSRPCRSRAFPELAPPSVTVSAFYTGANAPGVESAVTTPLEQAINGIEGLSYMTSSSTSSGFSSITVVFDIGRES
jgi:hypothetical protein